MSSAQRAAARATELSGFMHRTLAPREDPSGDLLFGRAHRPGHRPAQPALPVTIVVVGAGLGGLNVVEALRRSGCPAPLTLVGAEATPPYDRPPLSKSVLQTGGPAPLLRPVEHYAELDVDLRLGCRAIGLDATARSVSLDDGTSLSYDTLVLAPGAVPRRLPGAELPGMHVLRTQDDAHALRRDLLQAGAVTVIGGGFLGCEAAASARSLDADVDLVELLPGPLVRVLGPRMAARLLALHVEHGVRVHAGVGVTAVHGTARVESVELDDGRSLPARAVLVALGVVPDTAWLAGSGLDLMPDGGIACDSVGRTSLERVWALGDAAAWADSTGRQRRVEHWTSAVEQASSVAASLLAEGEPVAQPRVPYVWSDQYGSTLQCVGETAPETEVELLQIGSGLAAVHADGDRLLGVALLDARKQAGRARRLLAAGADLATARATLSA